MTGGIIAAPNAVVADERPQSRCPDEQVKAAGKPIMGNGQNNSLDGIFRQRYIGAMKWEVEYTDEFGQWWSGLSKQEQISVAASVQLLEERGPSLGFPHSSGINGSKHSHMRELRTQHLGRPFV